MANTPTVRKQPSKLTATGAERSPIRLRPQNRKLLKWLDSWVATPDDCGEKWWTEFEHDLGNHRTTFRPAQSE
jgi:hypothetical protein